MEALSRKFFTKEIVFLSGLEEFEDFPGSPEVKRPYFSSKVVQSSRLLNGWGKEFWRSARGWTSWELASALMSIFFFSFR